MVEVCDDVDELCVVMQIIGNGSVALQTGTHELRRPTARDPAPCCDDLRRRDVDATDPERVSGDPLRCRHVIDLLGADDDGERSGVTSSVVEPPVVIGSAIT